MPRGLKRYYGEGSLHFITWSCYRRKPLLGNPVRRDLVVGILELMRVRHRFAVIGYALMPEHEHLLISGRKAKRLPAAGYWGRILRPVPGESFLRSPSVGQQ